MGSAVRNKQVNASKFTTNTTAIAASSTTNTNGNHAALAAASSGSALRDGGEIATSANGKEIVRYHQV